MVVKEPVNKYMSRKEISFPACSDRSITSFKARFCSGCCRYWALVVGFSETPGIGLRLEDLGAGHLVGPVRDVFFILWR